MKNVELTQKRLEEIGTVLKAIRKTSKISQPDLAELTGWKQSFLSGLESNEKTPSLQTLLKWLNAAGYSVFFVRKKK